MSQPHHDDDLCAKHSKRSVLIALSPEERAQCNNEIRKILENDNEEPQKKFTSITNYIMGYFGVSPKKIAEETYLDSKNQIEKGVAYRILNFEPNALNSQLINWLKVFDVLQIDDDNYMHIMLLIRKIKNYNYRSN